MADERTPAQVHADACHNALREMSADPLCPSRSAVEWALSVIEAAEQLSCVWMVAPAMQPDVRVASLKRDLDALLAALDGAVVLDSAA